MGSNSERLPNWSVWQNIPEPELWQAVALSLNIDPNKVTRVQNWDRSPDPFDEGQDFKDRIFMSVSNLGKSPYFTLSPRFIAVREEMALVSLPAMAAWSVELKWPCPPDFTELAKKFVLPPRSDLENPPSSLQHIGRSEKLSFLLQASDRFWANAKLGEGDTHPRQEAVQVWLEERGFSPSLADKAATIIRPDWAKKGRPPKEQ